jgi:serine O-acetyltransferase
MSNIAKDANWYLDSWSTSNKPRAVLALRLLIIPGFQLMLMLRLQRRLGKIPVVGKGLRMLLWYVTTIYFSCDIDPQAELGPGLYLPHPVGIVIGGATKIGAQVAINQNVTIGGTGGGRQNPVIEDGVHIGAGAVIVGGLCIGRGSIVGANSVVNRDVPPDSLAVGAPAQHRPLAPR